MTDLSCFGLSQLAQILSALENARRNPNSKKTAMKAIARICAEIGVATDDVAAAAAGLLDGRLSPAAWRAALGDAAIGDEASADVLPDEDAPSAATAAPEAEADSNMSTDPQELRKGSGKQQLLAACRAAERWLQAAGDCGTPADEVLRELRAAIARGERGRAVTGEQPRRVRTETKQARLMAMLQRGASITDMSCELGWLRHTCHGALAGLKKRGLTIVSDRPAGGERIYRTPASLTTESDPMV